MNPNPKQLDDQKSHIALLEKDIVIKNIAYLASELFGYNYIFIQNSKNISCKIGQIFSGFDNCFWDIWERHFPAFKINCHCKNIVFPSNVIHESLIISNNNGVWKTTFNMSLLIKKT